MSGPPPKYTEAVIAEALRRSGGIKRGAARILGVDYRHFREYFNRYPALQAVCEECREMVLDDAEEGLAKLVAEGNIQAIMFILKTLGKIRGYGVRYEVTGADGAPLVDVSKLTDDELRQLAGRVATNATVASVGGIGVEAAREAGDEPN